MVDKTEYRISPYLSDCTIDKKMKFLWWNYWSAVGPYMSGSGDFEGVGTFATVECALEYIKSIEHNSPYSVTLIGNLPKRPPLKEYDIPELEREPNNTQWQEA